jgi:hypothetical protein
MQTHQQESPLDVLESRGCNLEIEDIDRTVHKNAKTDTLCANVSREDFTIERSTAGLNTKAIKDDDHVQSCHSPAESDFVGSPGSVYSFHSRENYQCDNTSNEASHDERLTSEAVAQRHSNDGRGDRT